MKGSLVKIRMYLVYLLAVLLVLVVPLMFFAFQSGLPETLARVIPLREGTFVVENGKVRLVLPGEARRPGRAGVPCDADTRERRDR
jgi:hypothetical protein